MAGPPSSEPRPAAASGRACRPPGHVFLARAFLLALLVLGIGSLATRRGVEEVRLAPCMIRQLTEIPCPGCGMTRACLSIARGNLASAWSYHPFSFVIVTMALGWAFLPRRVESAWARLPPISRRSVEAIALILLILLWIHRLAG